MPSSCLFYIRQIIDLFDDALTKLGYKIPLGVIEKNGLF